MSYYDEVDTDSFCDKLPKPGFNDCMWNDSVLRAVCAEVDTLRQQLAEARKDGAWHDGVPEVPEGVQRAFLCSTNGVVLRLLYSNRFVGPASDETDPESEDEVAPDSGEYYWTGWFEESCDQCDTFWRWDKPVEGWMPLPAARTGAPRRA